MGAPKKRLTVTDFSFFFFSSELTTLQRNYSYGFLGGGSFPFFLCYYLDRQLMI